MFKSKLYRDARRIRDRNRFWLKLATFMAKLGLIFTYPLLFRRNHGAVIRRPQRRHWSQREASARLLNDGAGDDSTDRFRRRPYRPLPSTTAPIAAVDDVTDCCWRRRHRPLPSTTAPTPCSRPAVGHACGTTGGRPPSSRRRRGRTPSPRSANLPASTGRTSSSRSASRPATTARTASSRAAPRSAKTARTPSSRLHPRSRTTGPT